MGTTTDDQELEKLRAEVSRLRTENDLLRAGDAGSPSDPEPAAATAPRPRRRWRGWVSALCIVLAAVLVPVSIMGSWTRAQLVDEQRFVDTFGPLADDPNVQALIIDRTSTAIDDAVDIGGLTDTLFDGIASLDLPPAALNALNLLRAPAASGAKSLVTQAITQVVESDAFTAVWDKALVATHKALVAAATGGEGDALSISGNGELAVQLGPIIDDLKTALADNGFSFASAIPAMSISIVIAQSDALTAIGPAYTIATTVGYVLPFVSLGLFLLGILLARRRSTATLGTGIGIGIGGGVVAAGLAAGGLTLSLQSASLGIPAVTLQAVYDTVTGRMTDTALVLLIVGIIVALAAWLGGRWTPARRVRNLSSSLTTSARRGLQRRGLTTGRFGAWLYRQRLLVRIAVVVLAVLVLTLTTPLALAKVIGTLVVALIVWLVLELLAISPDDPAAEQVVKTEEDDATEEVDDSVPAP